ncbi:uncharacterized protein [Haliotis asinina]|uniref:uncharacterized protein n=1 Tax=Haliotis asinina TaxID=109174 RepID=UPI00353193E3
MTMILKKLALAVSRIRGLHILRAYTSSTSHVGKSFSTAREVVGYEVRRMRREDIQGLYELTAANQWNMERDYLECIFDTDSSGLLVVVTPTGEVIGHNGILAHSDAFASSGMNIVKEEYRGAGIGKTLFRAVMDVMNHRNVGGTSLSNRITFYQQFGWTIPSYTFHYNMGPVNPDFVKESSKGDFDIIPIEDVSFEDVVAYDTDIHTLPRPSYLRNWVLFHKAKTVVAVQNGKVCGYGVLRPADIGFRMYPLFADSDKIAHALFCKLASFVPENGEVIFTQPIENKKACEFVQANKFKNYLSMTRLYNKHDIVVDINRVYSVSSTEYAIV